MTKELYVYIDQHGQLLEAAATHAPVPVEELEFPEFPLVDTQLTPPHERRGRVVREEKESDTYTFEDGRVIDCVVTNVFVENPVVSANLEEYKALNGFLDGTEEMLRSGGYNEYSLRTEAIGKEQLSPLTLEFCRQIGAHALIDWRGEVVPSPEALTIVRRLPVRERLLIGTHGHEKRTDRYQPVSAAMLTLSTDAVHIVNRDTVMRHEIMKFLQSREGETVKWLSLGCGTVENAFAVSKWAKKEHGVDLDITVADLRKDSLAHAAARAAVYSVGIREVDANVYRAANGRVLSRVQGDKNVQKALGNNVLFDIVDIKGTAEYMRQRHEVPGVFGSHKSKFGYADDLLVEANSLVAPGGMLNGGNMMSTRAHKLFGDQVQDWPYAWQLTEDVLVGNHYVSCPGAKLELRRIIDVVTGKHVYASMIAIKPN